MFRAIGRYMRAIGYLVTGRIDEARKTLSVNPAVVQATYDKVIEEKTKRIHQYKEAVGAMIAQEEKKKTTLKQLSDEVTRLKQLRDGAAAMAKKVVERHHGNTEAVKNDPEYLKCQAAFKDFSSTLEEKERRCAEIEEDIREFEKNIGGHKTQLQSLLREIDKIRQEKHSTVAEMLTAREEKEIADMLSGISRIAAGRTAETRDKNADARVAQHRARLLACRARWPVSTTSEWKMSSLSMPHQVKRHPSSTS